MEQTGSEKMIKNFPVEEVVSLSAQVSVAAGQVVSKTLAQNKALSVTLFAFSAGEEIGAHDSSGDALVTVLEGRGRFVIEDRSYVVGAGESLIMPAKKMHSVHADEDFKMLLLVVFPKS